MRVGWEGTLAGVSNIAQRRTPVYAFAINDKLREAIDACSRASEQLQMQSVQESVRSRTNVRGERVHHGARRGIAAKLLRVGRCLLMRR